MKPNSSIESTRPSKPGRASCQTLGASVHIALVVVALLLIGTSALANGPDEWELFGITKSGQKVLLTYGGYQLEEANGGMPLYLDHERPEYGYCRPEASTVEGEYFLRCSQQPSGKPNLVFKKDADGENTAYYREAKAIYIKEFKDEDGYRAFSGYYRCVEGCNAKVAKLLVEINYGD